MNEISYTLEFITPLFSYGAMQDQPEIRPASIRGQLHWWLRTMGGTAEQEQQIFGSVHKTFGNAGKAKSSAVVVRVSNITGEKGTVATLPHKSGGQAAPREAYNKGTSFDLHFSFRGTPLSPQLYTQFKTTLESWLAVGSLGLRSTRASGSFTARTRQTGEPLFQGNGGLQAIIQNINNAGQLHVSLLDGVYTDTEVARKIVSDTIGGRNDTPDQKNDLARIHYPLGSMKPRKTSPLRFRVVQLGNSYHILAIWDRRNLITENSYTDLKKVIDMLVDKKKTIGSLLMNSELYGLNTP